jgi:zinc protease
VNVTTPPITAERRAVVTDRVELPRVYMAWITPAFFQPGDADADVAASVLGGGNSSRLYKKLVYEQQIAQDVTAFQYSLALGSTFQIVATVRPGHTPDEVEKAINVELDKLRQSGPDETEVERARNTFETSMLTGLEVLGGFGGVADTLNMFNHYVGDPGYLPKYLQEHRQVTPASVKAFVAKYLQPRSRVVIHGVPGQRRLAANVPTPPASKTAPGTGAESINTEAGWRQEQPKPAASRDVKLPTPTSFRLANGLTVIFHERPGMPVVAADLVIKTGGDANPADRPGLANFTSAMLDQGTQSRNALQIADDVAQLGASLAATSSKDSTIVSVGSLRKNFPAALNLLADIALRPNFPQAEVDRQRTSRQARLVEQRQVPSTVATIATLAALYGAKHPYGFIELGSESAVTATTRDDMMGFWKKTFVPGNAALVVAGAIGEADLRSLVEKTFGAWPAGTATSPALGAPETTAARLVLIDQPGAPQTAVLVSSIGVPRSTPDYAAISVMNSVLGGLFSSRINLNLREQHGYTYGAFSQFLFRKGAGPFWINAPVRTDATAAAVTEIFNEMRRMTTSPMTADELAMAKDSIVRALPSDFETSAGTAGSLANLYVYDLGLDYYTKLPAQVSAVTADVALAAARKYLVPDRMIVVAVGDRAKIEPGLRKLNLGTVETRRADGSIVAGK